MARKSEYPSSKPSDSEPILRAQENFDGGMMPDQVATTLPSNAVAHLENATGHKNAIRGRRGSTLFSTLELPSITATDGALTVLTGTDGSAVDIYIDNTDESVEQLLDVDSVDSRIKFTLSDGVKTDHAVEGIVYEFDPNATVRYKVRISAVIPSEWLSATATTDVTLTKLRMRVNASYSDISINVQYYLIGNKVYAREQKNASWVEYFVEGDVNPLNSISRFERIYNNIVLFNLNGIFVLNNIDKVHYAYRINADTPIVKIGVGDVSNTFVTGSAYNYAYSYSRMRNIYDKNRLYNGSYIECETPPYYPKTTDEEALSNYVSGGINPFTYKPDYANNIYTTVKWNMEINDTAIWHYELSATGKNYKNWVDTESEAGKTYFFYVLYNGVSEKVYADFSYAKSIVEVVDIIDGALKSLDSNMEAHLLSSDRLVIYSRNDEDDIKFQTGGGDASNVNYMDSFFSEKFAYGIAGGVDVEYLYYPYQLGSLDGITHYSVYRSKDIFPQATDSKDVTDARFQNSEDELVWVEDVPVVRIFKATFSGTTSFTSDDFTINDVGNRARFLYDSGGGTYVLDSAANVTLAVRTSNSDPYSYLRSIPTGSSGEFYGVIGSTRLTRITKVGNQVTVDANYPDFSDTDGLELVGKLLYYGDGSTSIVTAYDSATNTITTLDTDDKTNVYATYLPDYRMWKDTVTDIVQSGYSKSFPLKSAGYQPMPDSNITAYINGVLMSARYRYPEIYVSDVTDFKQMGYYNVAFQTNGKLYNGITDMVEVNGLISVFTSTETYAIDIRNSTVRTTEFGESYTIISDPELVSRGIGTPQPDRWTKTDNNTIIIITNEPAVREFSGMSFNENLADGAVQVTYLENMSNTIVSAYNSVSGLNFWGIKND